MESVYFDSSVFLAILSGKAEELEVRALMKELRRDKVRIVTSMVSIQEISVLSFRRGTIVEDNHTKVSRWAHVQGVTLQTALTAAKLEAQLKDRSLTPDESVVSENKRRKFDCFHIGTAIEHKCTALYSYDKGMLKRKKDLGAIAMKFLTPAAKEPVLDLRVGKGSETLPIH